MFTKQAQMSRGSSVAVVWTEISQE